MALESLFHILSLASYKTLSALHGRPKIARSRSPFAVCGRGDGISIGLQKICGLLYQAMKNFTICIFTSPSKLHGLIGDYLSLQQAGNTDSECRFSLAGANFYTYGYGFAVPKGSPWAEEATLSVLKNQENGSIQAIIDYWFNKKECNTRPVKKLTFEKFVGLFLLIAGVIGFCFMALISEMLIIFLLIKFGRHLGPIGKFLKRMIFSVRKGQENEIHIKWLQLYKHHKSMRPNQAEVATASEVSFRRASFCNLSFEYSSDVLSTDVNDEQTLKMRRRQTLDADYFSHENGDISEPSNITGGTNENILHSHVSIRSRTSSQRLNLNDSL